MSISPMNSLPRSEWNLQTPFNANLKSVMASLMPCEVLLFSGAHNTMRVSRRTITSKYFSPAKASGHGPARSADTCPASSSSCDRRCWCMRIFIVWHVVHDGSYGL